MDFHSLARRHLQSLCKRNKIPANMTNIAMADALQALQSVQGIAEIQEALQFQSPQKLDLVSPAPLPRTTGRRTASRKVVEEAAEEPREQQASPLPRSRRVTARAPEIDEVVEEERAKKEVQETPMAPNTRRRASKKEEGAVAEAPTVTTRRRATKKEAAETPAAARTCRKASALGAVEAQKEEKTAGVTAGRRARQSSKKEVEAAAAADLMSDGLRKSTRVRGRGAAVKMASLAKEEEEQEKEAEDYVDQNNDDDKEEEEKEIKDIMEAVLEAKVSADLNSEEKDEKSSEESSENNQNQEDEDEAVAGFEGSPIRGLIDQDPYQQQQNPPPSAEITAVAVDGEFELQEPSTTIDLGSDMIAAETSAEATESSEHDGKMMEESEKDTGDNANITATVTGESGDGDSEITAEIEESDGEKSDDLITVEIDESGTDLICSDVAREITAEAVEEQKQPPPPEIAGESGDEVGELIEDLSDLNLSFSSEEEETSANDEMPPAVSSGNKENGDLTALTAAEAKQHKFESMSLRKLRAVYKETLVTMNNTGEEKRAALQATDDNCI